MSAEVCSYFNVGYCKLKDNCTKFHPSDDCEKMCKDKACLKRHRRACKDKDECVFHRSKSCEFKHDTQQETPDSTPPKLILDLKNLVEALLKENAEFREATKMKDIEINYLKESLSSIISRVEKLENSKIDVKNDKIKCDQCDFEGKNEQGLKTHKKRMHPVQESVTEDIHKSSIKSSGQGKCEMCNFKAKTPQIFYSHMKKAHNIPFEQSVKMILID